LHQVSSQAEQKASIYNKQTTIQISEVANVTSKRMD